MTRQAGPLKRGRKWSAFCWLLGALVLLVLPLPGEAPYAAEEKDTCVECHSNPDFLVQNKKLYDYYQNWTLSAHSQEQVACSDCHGGNPRAPDKERAHAGTALRSAEKASPINYVNIPTTCGQCHEEIFNKYRQNSHFKHLEAGPLEEQGPSCVTCHGSVNTTVLNVSTVGKTCRQCHNAETGNYPEIPAQAESVLHNFLSIHRYYRFIALRAEAGESRAFFRIVDQVVKRLNAEWHTFDLEKITQQTEDLIQFMKVKRNALRRSRANRK